MALGEAGQLIQPIHFITFVVDRRIESAKIVPSNQHQK
jgi:hypothetical protein